MNGYTGDALSRELQALYDDASKHSSYQTLPDFIAEQIGYQVTIDQQWRGDRVRYDFLIADGVLPETGTLADFGANTGFFSLTLAHARPGLHVFAIEANPNHATLIRRLADIFGLTNLQVIGRAAGIDDLDALPAVDVMLHLNVLHHAGSDFDRDRVRGTEEFDTFAMEYLKRLRTRVGTLVFQMGTNLGGDKSRPIVPFDADARKAVYHANLFAQSGWHIARVAYPVRSKDGSIEYVALAGDAKRAFDAMDEAALARALAPLQLGRHVGEFYRRPLLVARPES